MKNGFAIEISVSVGNTFRTFRPFIFKLAKQCAVCVNVH